MNQSLNLILESGIGGEAQIIDVGGGVSTLADDLLAKGFNHVTVLDISAAALGQSKKRLAEKSGQIVWMEADILKANLPQNTFDLWHDRAVFHFLTNLEEQKSYLNALKQSLKAGGFAVMASFSLEGPPKCSGLEVMRYSPETLSKKLGPAFSILKTAEEHHRTPFDTCQAFIYCLFKKTSV